MGGQKSFLKSGGFIEYLYHQVGETITATNISGKIIAKSGDASSHEGLPLYSNTSKVYFKLDDQTKVIEQARVYEERRAYIDFDWGHSHGEYPQGVVHVHEWYTDKKGNLKRRQPRLMNNDEMNQYGELLKKSNPQVRFR